MQSIDRSIGQKYGRELHFHSENWFFFGHCILLCILGYEGIILGYGQGPLDELYPNYRLLWTAVRHCMGFLPWWKTLMKTLLAPFLYFFPLRRVVMRARRHIIINANTQFLLCALHPAFRERENRSRKRKGNVGRDSMLAETMSNERSYSHTYMLIIMRTWIPRNPRLSWLREWRSNDQWFSSKCPCNCVSEAARPLIELIRIYNRRKKISLLNLSYHCCRMIDDWTLQESTTSKFLTIVFINEWILLYISKIFYNQIVKYSIDPGMNYGKHDDMQQSS